MTVSDAGSSPMIFGGDGMGMGGGGFIWAFLIFALLFGGFGNNGGNDALAMAALLQPSVTSTQNLPVTLQA